MKVHLLVGTRKGAFIFSSDEARQSWSVSDLLFAGWKVQHLVAGNGHLYAVVDHDVWGSHVHRSADFGQTWTPIDPPQTLYPGGPNVKRWWHLAIGNRPNELWIGGDPGALFRSSDNGDTWEPVLSLNQHATRKRWFEGAGGMMVHSIMPDPFNLGRTFLGISVAGVFRSDDDGANWIPKNKEVLADFLPVHYPEVGQCCHHLITTTVPDLIYQQNHCGVYRSEDAGETWIDCCDGLPARFGFPIDVLPHKPQTIFVVPQVSPDYRYVPEGKFRVYRSCNGGDSWEALTNGLPQEQAYLTVHRQAMAVDHFASGGVYVGTAGGHLYFSRDEGDHWDALHMTLPPIYALEVFMEDSGTTESAEQEIATEVLLSQPEPLSPRQLRRQSMRRAGPYTDRLLSNEGVRRNLLDGQAQKLIGWAVERIETMAAESAEMSDESAERLLSTLTNGVTDVIRQIDRLIGAEDDGDIADELRTIAEKSAEDDTDTLFEKLFNFATQSQGEDKDSDSDAPLERQIG